ncbi:hypothetical protein V8B97DRAFT_1677321 [Scleroderma yunnanense]
MVVIDEKAFCPPPPYAPGSLAPPPFAGSSSQPIGISALPPNLLLHVIYLTFPRTPGIDEVAMERQRSTLYWLTYQLRLVNHAFYLACMHILRSTYLPAYQSRIRAPYTSDPFPMSSCATSSDGSLDTIQRETRVFDIFIALKAREDFFMDASELHTSREELFKDLFGLMQPRSRLEDLVRHYGMREGAVYITSPNAPSSSSAASTHSGHASSGSMRRHTKVHRQTSVPFSALSISFSQRKAGLLLLDSGRKRTILEVIRVANERLEVPAKKLAKQLRAWLDYA